MGRTLSQCIQIPNHHILNNLQFFLYIAIKLKLKKIPKARRNLSGKIKMFYIII